jgi:hypothetical protein
MRWPWTRRVRELEEAQNDKERAEKREQEVKPLVRKLHQHDRANHLSARVRASWLGGQQ